MAGKHRQRSSCARRAASQLFPAQDSAALANVTCLVSDTAPLTCSSVVSAYFRVSCHRSGYSAQPDLGRLGSARRTTLERLKPGNHSFPWYVSRSCWVAGPASVAFGAAAAAKGRCSLLGC